MNREYHSWQSPHLNRTMELLVFGHAGAKVLVFPTRDGRFWEYERIGLPGIADKVEAGHLQLYCVDSIAYESFYCPECPPKKRIQRHIQFERYILDEVLPMMAKKNPDPVTVAHGCSLGAFNAVNIAFRHPHLFQKVCGFSGRYDLTLCVEHFTDVFNGYYDEDVYAHTPSHFLPHLNCPERLAQLRRMEIVLSVGGEDPFLENNRQLSEILAAKGIDHSLFIWGGRAHRGRYWRQMAPIYL